MIHPYNDFPDENPLVYRKWTVIGNQVRQNMTDTINNMDNSFKPEDDEDDVVTNNNIITNDNNLSILIKDPSRETMHGQGNQFITCPSQQTVGWMLEVFEINNLSSQSLIFITSFNIVETDNNSFNAYNIYDSQMKILLSLGASDNSTLLNRINYSFYGGGTVLNVPFSISFLGCILLKILLNPRTVNDHFGELTIYGIQT